MPGEEEHRDDHEAEDRREARVGLGRRRIGGHRHRERRPDQDRDRDREQAEPRVDCAEGRDDRQVRGARGEHARDDEELVAEQHVLLGQRSRGHRVVGPRPLDRAHHRPARLGRRRLHRRRGEQARCDVVEVGNAGRRVRRLVDDRAEPDPERRQIEQRVDETRPQRAPPDALVLREPVLVGAKWLEDARPRQSTRVRPVRCRKTSSSVLRRMSVECGGSPRSAIAAAVASPSSV